MTVTPKHIEEVLARIEKDKGGLATIVVDLSGVPELKVPDRFVKASIDYLRDSGMWEVACQLTMSTGVFHRFMEGSTRKSKSRNDLALRPDLALIVCEYLVEKGFRKEAIHYADRFSGRALWQADCTRFFKRIMEITIEEGDYYKAGIFAQQAGLEEESRELFKIGMDRLEKKGNFYWAAVCAKSAKLDEETKRLYQMEMNTGKSRGRIYEAALSAEALGLDKEARELYLLEIERRASGGNFDGAQRLVEKHHIPIPYWASQSGIATLSRIGLHQDAAKNAERYGFTSTSIDIHLKMNNPLAASKVALRNGDISQAIGILEKAGMNSEADALRSV